MKSPQFLLQRNLISRFSCTLSSLINPSWEREDDEYMQRLHGRTWNLFLQRASAFKGLIPNLKHLLLVFQKGAKRMKTSCLGRSEVGVGGVCTLSLTKTQRFLGCYLLGLQGYNWVNMWTGNLSIQPSRAALSRWLLMTLNAKEWTGWSVKIAVSRYREIFFKKVFLLLYHYGASNTAYKDSTWRLHEAALLMTVTLCLIASWWGFPFKLPWVISFGLLGRSPAEYMHS